MNLEFFKENYDVIGWIVFGVYELLVRFKPTKNNYSLLWFIGNKLFPNRFIKLIIFFILINFSSNAQIWQTFKGVYYKGYNNAPQSPIPPAGYGSITFFQDSLGLYGYDTAWFNLRGSGGGTVNLTNTFVGFGSATNELTGESNFTYNSGAGKSINLNNGAGASATLQGGGVLPLLNLDNGTGSGFVLNGTGLISRFGTGAAIEIRANASPTIGTAFITTLGKVGTIASGSSAQFHVDATYSNANHIFDVGNSTAGYAFRIDNLAGIGNYTSTFTDTFIFSSTDGSFSANIVDASGSGAMNLTYEDQISGTTYTIESLPFTDLSITGTDGIESSNVVFAPAQLQLNNTQQITLTSDIINTEGLSFVVGGNNAKFSMSDNGTNPSFGRATLTAGAVTVNTTNVTANSNIFVISQIDGGTPGFLRISARTAATSFTITSSSGTDTSTVAWWIVEPN